MGGGSGAVVRVSVWHAGRYVCFTRRRMDLIFFLRPVFDYESASV